ncbi:MerR family transcriptional regulator [Agrococcus sp. SGAir0287]|uniref:MerR family transcriptional regulator n=1 Tax=Agrococcus sp. SGAir0287 TaxID=2070347 RepID=UPI0010CCF73A|nr:MerR family transcriptional regulator [Agrococcus sp. SGAir0287]QCR20371.1 MerR family transcriptional regulator [Agrococcus sp. SGAir0287]
MHVREVSAAAGVSVALVKFYVREGLLHPGVRESVNSTSYDETHVARLRLIRALVEGGRLSLAAVSELLDAIDDESLPIEVVVRDAHRAVSRVEQPPSEEAIAMVRGAIARHGWQISDDNPGVLQCAAVVDTAISVGRDDVEEMLEVYGAPVELIAREDLAAVGRAAAARSRVAETVVIGTVLGDAMLLGMRRIAQEHVARQASIAEPPRGTGSRQDRPPTSGHGLRPAAGA